MKMLLFKVALTGAAVFGVQAKADTTITVTNGGGAYGNNYLAFNDANGTHVTLDGVNGLVTLTYPDQVVSSFPYSQKTSGLTVTGSWTGNDESGYPYIASVTENLVQTKHSGSGRGGGYKTTVTTSLGSGAILYHYTGAYAPPLVAPVVAWSSTSNSATLTWTAASGGVPSYTYSVYDQNGIDVLDTSGLAATVPGLSPSSSYGYIVVTTDSAGKQIGSALVTIYTQAPTLDTKYTYDPSSNSVIATWSADPNAVSYSVFFYDWSLGVWVDGADTTGTFAVVSGWSPDVYVSFYVAAYDAFGVETDYDQQLVYVQSPPPPPDRGGSDD